MEGEASEPNLGLSSYLAAPIIGRTGEVLGGIFIGHSEAGVFNREAEDILVGIAGHAAIAMDNARLHRLLQDEVAQRRRAEEAKELLLNEMKHRVKNSLSTVMAIARQTFRDSPTGARAAFDARIQALASAHDLLTLRNWDGASVEAVVESALDPFRERNRERFRVSGPPAALDPNQALVTSMILHELGTNAVDTALLQRRGRRERGMGSEREARSPATAMAQIRRPASAAAAASRLWLDNDRTRRGRAWRRDTHRVRADRRRL